jgi:hypothetical protein
MALFRSCANLVGGNKQYSWLKIWRQGALSRESVINAVHVMNETCHRNIGGFDMNLFHVFSISLEFGVLMAVGVRIVAVCCRTV